MQCYAAAVKYFPCLCLSSFISLNQVKDRHKATVKRKQQQFICCRLNLNDKLYSIYGITIHNRDSRRLRKTFHQFIHKTFQNLVVVSNQINIGITNEISTVWVRKTCRERFTEKIHIRTGLNEKFKNQIWHRKCRRNWGKDSEEEEDWQMKRTIK